MNLNNPRLPIFLSLAILSSFSFGQNGGTKNPGAAPASSAILHSNEKNTLTSFKKRLPETKKEINLTHAGFYENKGQITDQNYKPNPGVKYLLCSSGFNVQLRQTGFSYDTYMDSVVKDKSLVAGQKMPWLKDKERPENFIRLYHRVDIELVGCNAHAQITAEGKSNAYYNYFTAGTPKGGVSNVHYYQKITYKNIYPSIDLEFTVADNRNPVKYNFIVHRGGNPADIKLQYKGANKVTLTGNKLVVSVTAGNFSENIPSSYISQGIPSGKDTKQPVEVSYTALGDNTYGFFIPNFQFLIPDSSDLIIDPTPNLDWGTYYGGTDQAIGYGIALDASDNVYITGHTTCTSAIATAGAYQATYGGDYDAFVAEFNSTGSALLWGTYYGGTGYDWAYGIALDGSDNVYITGQTSSTLAIATAGAYQTTFGGGAYDAFVAKFNSTGSALLWGTYYGGTGDDYGYGITLDASDNVYVTGLTESSSGIATVGAYQTSLIGAGSVFISEFSSTGSALLWGTYYGTAASGGHGIVLDASDNVYVTGSTYSASGVATAGAYQTICGGNSDAFVAKFNSTGSALLWGTYYGGTSSDLGQAIILDNSDNVYVIGQTLSLSGIATAGAFQTTNGGGNGDAFVAKFNSAGSALLWGTYYGGAGEELGEGIALDASDNVYITGYTISSSGMATAGAYQTIYEGSSYDVFVSKFNSTGSSLLWGTYYGKGGGQGIVLDGSGNVYVTGQTSNTSGIATAGAYQTINDGNPDAFVAKFDNTASLTGFPGSITYPLCNGGTGSATVTAAGGYSPYIYSWAPSGETTATGTGLTAGIYTVTVTDAFSNTATITVTITQPVAISAALGATSNVSCNGGNNGSATVNANGGTSPYRYSWAPSGQTNATSTGLSAGTYTVNIIDANGCTGSATAAITQPAAIRTTIDIMSNVSCNGGNNGRAIVNASGGTAPYTYSWSPSGQTSATSTGLSAGTYTVSITDATGCTSSAMVIVTQPPIVTVSICCDTLIDKGQSFQLISSGGGTYLWSPPTGLSCDTCPNPVAAPAQTTTYSVTVTNDNGCIATQTVTIEVETTCFNFTIPNVFTPNYPGPDGENNKFYINTGNLDTWSIVIYDRWDKEMFKTTNPTQYWDGKNESGGQAPDGVYYYIINATCQNTSYKKNGFLQLIR